MRKETKKALKEYENSLTEEQRRILVREAKSIIRKFDNGRTQIFNKKFIYVLSHITLIIGTIIPYKALELNELSWMVLGPLMVYISLIEIFKYKNIKYQGANNENKKM